METYSEMHAGECGLDDEQVTDVEIVKPVAQLVFFNVIEATEIYTLSLHDALPISAVYDTHGNPADVLRLESRPWPTPGSGEARSEEHTSELQSRPHLVCRLLLEKKNSAAQAGRTTASDSL